MRYVVYLLLFANIAYFGWNLVTDDIETRQAIPPVPEGVNPLVLLQEQQGDAQDTSADAAVIEAVTAALPPAAIRTASCRAVGPFALLDDVKAAAARLAGLGLQPMQRATQSRVENGYWVYLPRMSRDASRAAVQLLQEHEDTDYYVGKDYFIALGTYQDVDSATQRQAEVRAYGIDAIAEPRYRTIETWWLELPDSPETTTGLAPLLAEQPGLELHTLSCR